MKIIRTYMILLCFLAVGACGFLEGGTVGIVDNNRMFENEQGFIDAMNGVYALMTDADLYGESLSFGLADELAQLYYNDSQAHETTLSKTIDLKYTDSDVRKRIDRVWEKGYNAIAAANSIIDNSAFHSYPCLGRIRGEALAVRAFIHFDMLRMFAPFRFGAGARGIPYVLHFSNIPVAYSTVDDAIKLIVADLQASLEAMKTSAPVPQRQNMSLYIDKSAVLAMLARVYNWAGRHAEAEKCALEALEGGYKLVREENLKSLFHGYIADNECIWGLNAPKMYLNVKSRLMPTRITDKTNIVRLNLKEIYSVNTYTSTNNDYRYQSCFSEGRWGSGTTAFSKLYDKYYDENQQASGGRIPGINILRLPELYYILSESVYDRDKPLALKYLNKVVTSRGLAPLGLEDIAVKKSFENILINEITKEYWGEGQIFFTCKRFGIDMNGVDGKVHKASDKVYVLPLPEKEKEGSV